MIVDIKKKYKTKSGHDVELFVNNLDDFYPILGTITLPNGKRSAVFWCDNGKSGTWDHDNGLDLIEVKPRVQREVWLNVYAKSVWVGGSKAEADAIASGARIACVKAVIDCEEGEGL